MSAFETKFHNVTEPQAVAIMLRSFPELIVRPPDIVTMKEAESLLEYMIGCRYGDYKEYERLRKDSYNFRGQHPANIPPFVRLPAWYGVCWKSKDVFEISRSNPGVDPRRNDSEFKAILMRVKTNRELFESKYDETPCTHTYFVDAGVYHFETSTESQLDAFINRANAIIDDYHSFVYPSIIAAPEEEG